MTRGGSSMIHYMSKQYLGGEDEMNSNQIVLECGKGIIPLSSNALPFPAVGRSGEAGRPNHYSIALRACMYSFIHSSVIH